MPPDASDPPVGFRVEVPSRSLHELPETTLDQLIGLCDPGRLPGRYRSERDFARDVTVVEGEAPRGVVTMLLALAQGHSAAVPMIARLAGTSDAA